MMIQYLRGVDGIYDHEGDIVYLEEWLIYPISDSPWVSPVHCVPKKGGITVVRNEDNELIPTRLVTGWRVCIDYRKLNDATRKDHFPLPFMDQMLERLAGNEYYCFLDGFSGYFQIPIDPLDQEKTTFTCPYGTFAYRRMPFGLCNAPGTFQRCMVAIFHDMIEKTMEVFMDDFSVFGDSFSSCLSHLDKMLQRCEDTNLVLNWEKCHFMVKEGIVLGHKISKSGIEVDKAKVDVIAKLPHPTTVKGIRSFLGHAGFYRRFIQDFSKIARPMTHLLEKETPFIFSKECIEAFETLKMKLTQAPILVAPDWDLPFEIMCDASDFAVGAVLGQRHEAFDILIVATVDPTGGHYGAFSSDKRSSFQYGFFQKKAKSIPNKKGWEMTSCPRKTQKKEEKEVQEKKTSAINRAFCKPLRQLAALDGLIGLFLACLIQARACRFLKCHPALLFSRQMVDRGVGVNRHPYCTGFGLRKQDDIVWRGSPVGIAEGLAGARCSSSSSSSSSSQHHNHRRHHQMTHYHLVFPPTPNPPPSAGLVSTDLLWYIISSSSGSESEM
ncbi:reverse transcriptase domain-containing protein [Tanacetum coccineum]